MAVVVSGAIIDYMKKTAELAAHPDECPVCHSFASNFSVTDLPDGKSRPCTPIEASVDCHIHSNQSPAEWLAMKLPQVVGPEVPIDWNAARDHGLLWYINEHLQHIGLSIFLQASALNDDGTLQEPIAAVLGRNSCRGFEDDERERRAFSAWLAENAQANHDKAFPDE